MLETYMLRGINMFDKHIAKISFYEKSNLCQEMLKSCEDNGVFGEFYYYNPDSINKNRGVYFLVASFDETIQPYREDSEMFEKRLEWQKDNGIGEYDRTSGQFIAIDISDLDTENEGFHKYMTCMRAIIEQATIKAQMLEFGYAVPDEIARNVIYDSQKLYRESIDPSLPREVRNRSRRAWIEVCNAINEEYNKDNGWNKYMKEKQKQPLSYFTDNQININWMTINSDFYKFMDANLYKYPDFKFYKDAKPIAVYKDPKKVFRIRYDINLLTEERSGQDLRICYPSKYENVIQGLMLQYNSLKYDGRAKDLNEIEGPKEITVSQHDMWDFNSLCKELGVKYFVNDGRVEDLETFTARVISIVYSEKDTEKMNGILNRIAAKKLEINITTSEQRENNKEIRRDKPGVSITEW